MEAVMFDDDNVPVKVDRKFQWKDRLGLVMILAGEVADNGGKFEPALKAVRLSEYAFNASKMPSKLKAALKREVMQQAKDIRHLRETANVGDIVRVPKYKINPLLNCNVRDGLKLVEAEIIEKTSVSQTFRYKVRRLVDNGIQTGNGHMIKAIVSRAAEVIQ
jgi:hypothetical protein